MDFTLGDITKVSTSRGAQYEVACDCWFTSQGKTIPRSLKIKDQEGIIHTVSQIQVLTSESRRRYGIGVLEHVCRIVIGESVKTVRLIFRKDTCCWTMMFM